MTTRDLRSAPIAIVGIGCRFPQADDVHAFWDNLHAGHTSFEPIPDDRWHHDYFHSTNQRDVDKTWVPAGSFVHRYKEFAALHYGIAPRRLEVMDPQQRLLIEATRWAIQDAGYEVSPFERRRTGVFTGISVSEFKNITTARMHAVQMLSGDFGNAASEELRQALLELTSHVAPMRAFTLSGSLTALNAAAVAQVFDLGGPAFTIDSACASASVAIHTACQHLRSGELDQAVAGGAYVNLSPDNLVAFTKIGAISPTGMCRPFDEQSDGFVQSDGVGMLFLKRLDDAIAQGDRIHAVIRGSGCNNDGRGEGPMTPKVDGQLEVLRMAYEDAGFSPDTVAYFEAHGTATSIGDPVEVKALGRFLMEAGVAADDRRFIGSVKGNIGHAMSAAGVAGVIKAIQMIAHRRLPPQPNFTRPNPALRMDQVPLQVSPEAMELSARSGSPLRIGVSSFGFGGTNSHLVLEAPPAAPADEPRLPEVGGAREDRLDAVLVTAPTPALLAQHCRVLADFLETGPGRHHRLADVVYTLNARRRRERVRATVGARTRSELLEHLRTLAADLSGDDVSLPRTVSPHIGVTAFDPKHHQAPKLCYLFPGQGAQRLDLLRSLHGRFSRFREAFDRFRDAASGRGGHCWVDVLYPPPDASEDDRAELEATLRRTEHCQPVMAALSLALMELLESFGLSPDLALGHSLGEFTALAAASALDRTEAVALVADRGQAMADLNLPDPGRMAAVMTGPSEIRADVDATDGVVVANSNHPRQCVISGRSDGVQRLIDRFTERGLDVRPLPVSHAFHSPLLSEVDPVMAERLARCTRQAPRCPVISCVADHVHGPDLERTLQVLEGHATAPVDFRRGLETARAAGAEAFLQVGAGTALLGFARATLGDEATTFQTSALEPDGGYTLIQSLCQLSARGVEVDFEAVYAGEGRRPVSLPETPLEREEYWPVKERPQPLPRISSPVPTDRPVVRSPAVDSTPPAAAAAGPSAELVALFREQTQLLQQQAQVLAEQTRALAGSGGASPAPWAHGTATGPTAALPAPADPVPAAASATPTAASSPGPAAALAAPPLSDGTPHAAPAQPAREPDRPAEPASAPATGPSEGPSTAEIERQVFQLVARVSAFPENNVHADQRLVDELGFDSLMVGDLSGAIERAFPEAGGLPQSLFSLSTTVGDISQHLVQALRGGERSESAEAVEAPVDRGPVVRHRVRPVRAPAAPATGRDPAGRTWLLTTSDGPRGEALQQDLERRGARVLRVVLKDDPGALPTELNGPGETSWPRHRTAELAEKVRGAYPDLQGWIHEAAVDGTDRTVLELLGPVHALAAALDPEHAALLTGMGGTLGLAPGGAGAPAQGALIGYAQSLGRERPQRVVRAIDVDPCEAPRACAAAVLAEVLAGPAETEVGLAGGKRWTAAFGPADREPSRSAIGPKDVVLVTGGAGEIGSQAALRIAARRPKAILLVGRRPSDRDINALLGRLSAAGTTGVYVQADASGPELKAAVAPIEARVGPVTVAIHAAGLIEDAAAPKKDWASVERVVRAKVQSAEMLQAHFPELRDLILFTSWAGRFGNAGQVDYAAANAVLDRWAATESEDRRVVALAWPPWDGTAMVRSIPGPVRRAMEAQGVTFLGMDEGLDLLEQVLDRDARGVQLVGAETLRRPVQRTDVEAFSAEGHPYLNDHRLKGQPVVPMASVLDWISAATAAETVVVEDLELVRGIRGDDVCRLKLDGSLDGEGRLDGQVELEVDVDDSPQTAYRARVRGGGEGTPAQFSLSGDPVPSHFPVADFYERFTFHGPRFRGIERVERQTTDGIEGWVIGSDPAAWMPGHRRTRWSVDPLVVDAAFQLAGYWTSQQAGRTGYPIRIGRLVRVRPMTERVRCTIRLTGMEADRFRGDILFRDPDGRILTSLEGVEGRFAEVRTEDVSSESNEALDRVTEIRRDRAAKTTGTETALDVQPETYQVSRFPELEALDQRFQMAELMGLKNPYFRTHLGTARDTSVVEGVEMLNFSSYNYLGFSGRREVVEAAQTAIEQYGTSVSASRVASGERPLHRELESGIAAHIGVEDALLFVSGHATNVTTVGHLLDRNDLVLHDSLIHDSALQGIYLSGATRRPFPHNDLDALEKALGQVRSNFRRVLVIAEGIYSMDGDTCDLPRLIELKERFKTLLMIDEAHSIGVLGPAGKGVSHHFHGVNPKDVDIWMGTLSKSFASCGGYIAGSEDLIRYLKYTAPGFVYSAGLPPPNAAAALKSLELMQQEPETVEQLRSRSRFFLNALRDRGINTGDAIGAAVVPAIIGNSLEALRLSEALAEQQINVQPIVYPAVEDDAARLRFFISALHSEAQLERTADAVRSCLDQIRSSPGQSVSL
ncbi:MAG TPA: aminotransferase class I/II-fold pyridoxal phosphate-dependent enzyme [Myxococcales bacterium LLY-WYZ-16_1]|nr:aminotransferase class I/II-fold pyridoxal phosphate-dependent enzyme [Myxococcales bacterium LLY-WYZ-16_1]